jgi:rhodanese-related sulfurtransferase
VLSDGVASFARSGDKISVTLKSGLELNCDMVMLSIGIKPNTELARSAGLEIGNRGGIKVNEYMQTSNPDIFAVGDSVETMHVVTGEPSLIALAGPANRQGRLVADNICGRRVAYRGTLGTSVVRLFDRTAAATGANEKTLQRLGLPYQKCYLHPFSHATYYPDAKQMAMKLLFSPDSGRILGAQIVGDDGVDKRIDVLATAIMAGMGVEDLTHLELGYVPQYGSAKDPINMAGYVASNIVRGDMPVAYWDDVRKMTPDKDILLDVRTKEEFSQGSVPQANNLPLDELRNRLGELDKDATIYPFCRVGQRSYMATRVLKQHGFNAKNLSGGFLTYKNQNPDEDKR